MELCLAPKILFDDKSATFETMGFVLFESKIFLLPQSVVGKCYDWEDLIHYCTYIHNNYIQIKLHLYLHFKLKHKQTNNKRKKRKKPQNKKWKKEN